ncbi:MAG: cation diffusion facilitator family transporter [Saprospiraceae bacterium]
MSVSEKLSDNFAIKTVAWSMASNFVLAIIKWLAGYFGHSYALIADAIESSTDVFTSFLLILALRYANKPADENHPYGHGKVEPLATFLVVLFLICSAGLIAYQSIINIQTPHELPKPFTLIILAGIIIWKELSFRYVNKQGEESHSTSLKAEAWHHRSDSITSLAAFLGIGLALYLGKGYESADDWAALLASVLILYNCFLIFRPALGEIMDEHFYDDIVAHVRTVAVTVPGIIGTEKCYIRKAGMKYQVDLHAIVDGNITVSEGHRLAHDLQDSLMEQIPGIAHIIIHIEPDQE